MAFCIFARCAPRATRKRGGAGRLDDPLTRTVDAATEQKYPVLLEYAKASFERIDHVQKYLAQANRQIAELTRPRRQPRTEA